MYNYGVMETPSAKGQGDFGLDVHQPRSPQESQLLQQIRDVNEKRQQLLYESTLCNRIGNVERAVRKQRAAEEARRYLNTLVSRHKRYYRRRPINHL